jgi:hypothetical protein
MSLEEVKKEYEKYGFTNFKKVNKRLELQVLKLDEVDFLNALCRVACSNLSNALNYVAPFFIQGGYYNGVIMSNVTKEDAAGAKDLYKEIMVLYHEALIVQFKGESSQIAFFKKFTKEYLLIEEKLIPFVEICGKVFTINTPKPKSGSRGYLG